MNFVSTIISRLMGLFFLLMGLNAVKIGINTVGIFLPVGAIFTIIGFCLFSGLLLLGDTGYKKHQQTEAEKREGIIKAGIEGEKRVNYALSNLNQDEYIVINDISLKNNGLQQQFDHIVISKKGIFNLETKNYSGSITIDEDGNWSRIKPRQNDSIREGIENPLAQLMRHKKVLQSILGNKISPIDVLVLANEACTIEGTKNSPVKVVKYDSLGYFIENYDSGTNEFNIKEITDKLSEYKVENKVFSETTATFDTNKGRNKKLNPVNIGFAAIGIVIILQNVTPQLMKKFNPGPNVVNTSNEKVNPNKNQSTAPAATQNTNTNENTAPGNDTKQSGTTQKIYGGKVVVSIQSVEQKGKDLYVNGTIENNSSEKVGTHSSLVFLKYSDNTVSKLNFHDNTKFTQSYPANTKGNFTTIFKNVDLSKKPFKLIGELNIAAPTSMEDRTFQLDITN